MTDTPNQPQPTDEQRQSMRNFLSGAALVSINNSIQHGAQPADAALAHVAAAINVLLDLMPLDEIDALLGHMIANLRAQPQPRAN